MNNNCCDIRAAISEPLSGCSAKKGGIKDVRIACYKFVTVVNDTCADGSGNDAKITDIVTTDVDNGNAIVPLFYTVAIKDKSSQHLWDRTYEEESGGIKNNESMTLVIEAKTRDVRCILSSWIGQVVCIIFKERGTDEWYMAGWTGSFRVTKVSGGTGTDTFTPITVEVTGTDVDDVALQIFDTDIATTESLVAGVTAP